MRAGYLCIRLWTRTSSRLGLVSLRPSAPLQPVGWTPPLLRPPCPPLWTDPICAPPAPGRGRRPSSLDRPAGTPSPGEGDADPPLWTGPRAPPALGGDTDCLLWTIPPMCTPSPGWGRRHCSESPGLGAAPPPRGSWASQAPHGLFLKPLPLVWLPAPVWPPAWSVALGPWRAGLSSGRCAWGYRAPGCRPASALSLLRKPPSCPLVGWRLRCRPSNRRWALGRGAVLGPSCPAALCRARAVGPRLQLLPTELALRPLLAPGDSVLKATSQPPCSHSPGRFLLLCFSFASTAAGLRPAPFPFVKHLAQSCTSSLSPVF